MDVQAAGVSGSELLCRACGSEAEWHLSQFLRGTEGDRACLEADRRVPAGSERRALRVAKTAPQHCQPA